MPGHRCVDAHHEYMWFVTACPTCACHSVYFLIILTLVVASCARMAVCVYMRRDSAGLGDLLPTRDFQLLCALLPLATFYYPDDPYFLRDHRSANTCKGVVYNTASDISLKPKTSWYHASSASSPFFIFSAFLHPCPSPWNNIYLTRPPFSLITWTIASACSGGTTASMEPWRIWTNMFVVESHSRKDHD